VQELSELTESGSSCLDLKKNDLHSYDDWLEILQCDAPDSAVGSPGSNAPLILSSHGKLYLQRYFLFEHNIFQAIDRATQNESFPLTESIEKRITQLFPDPASSDQADATRCALKNRFCIISGGPGTGKTTTVVKILLLLQELGIFTKPSDCLLLAPTGKAADRLHQSILSGLVYQKIPIDNFPTETSTIHRALGWLHGTIEFRHHAQNPLNAKVVVIDETSMVDLPLMARLLDAIPETAKIILLGDKNQLSSVDVGTVLNDLMEASEQSNHPIRHCAVMLRKSWRTTGSISETCDAIRDGDSTRAWNTIIHSHQHENPTDTLGAITLEQPPKNLYKALLPFVKKHWLPVLLNPELSDSEKLQEIDNFRILAPTHNGPYGVQTINQTVDKILMNHGIDNPKRDIWYAGRSVIIQSNDYALGIFNGDIGLTLPSASSPQDLHVCFQSGDQIKHISPSLLPETNTAWGLTIHRTQGSEYNHILLIIPPSPDATKPSKILTRELLYTGLSRAKHSATLWCTEESLSETINTTVQRASGLSEQFKTP